MALCICSSLIFVVVLLFSSVGIHGRRNRRSPTSAYQQTVHKQSRALGWRCPSFPNQIPIPDDSIPAVKTVNTPHQDEQTDRISAVEWAFSRRIRRAGPAITCCSSSASLAVETWLRRSNKSCCPLGMFGVFEMISNTPLIQSCKHNAITALDN
eukprot:Filipodium_phascolosomae@DN3218_c0_g1_i1.p1